MSGEEKSSLYKEIKPARLREGLTQEDLAQKLDIHQTEVSNWELGKAQVPKHHLPKLQEILGELGKTPSQRPKTYRHSVSGFRKSETSMAFPSQN